MKDDINRISRRLTKIEQQLEIISKNILKPPEDDRRITVNEAAQILGCSPQAVRNAIHNKQVKSIRIGRKFYLSFHEIRLCAGYLDKEKKELF